MKRVLVAGATGYLGRYVVRAFKEHGWWVRALARNPLKLKSQGPFLEPAVDSLIDDLFVGEVTRPETLEGLCDGVDVVFSSIGITRQKDRLTFRDVDYQGNRNILDRALEAGSVQKFVFVSVFRGPELTRLAGIRAREDFVADLAASGLDYAVVRPTGYFSDASEVLRMAMRGRVWLMGDGHSRMNPIHGSDLAQVCVAAAEGTDTNVNAGGPDVFSYREMAELAFRVTGRKPRISTVPVWLMKGAAAMMRPLSEKHADLLEFFLTAMTSDSVAPRHGTHHLEDYYRQMFGVLNGQ